MKPNLLIGIVVAVVGIVLLVIGFNATDSFGERMSETFTGHYTDKTTWFIVGGIAALVIGAGFAFAGGRLKLNR